MDRVLARIALILALAGVASAADWSGTFTVVQTLTGPTPAGADRRALEEEAKALEQRLARTREALKTATPMVARTLRQDIGHLETELERLALERGGTVTIARTRYAIAGPRIAADGDDDRVFADTAAGTAIVVRGVHRDTVALTGLQQPPPPEDASDAGTVAGQAAKRCTVRAGKDAYVVVFAPALPNPYAMTRLPEHRPDALHTALAGVPGLPLTVERALRNGVQRWTVRDLVAGPVDDSALAP
jgi:hypothetical protein